MIACLLLFEVISIKVIQVDVLIRLFLKVNGPFTNFKNKQPCFKMEGYCHYVQY